MPSYNSAFVASRIKELLSAKKISVSKMLSDINMNKNALVTMQSSGYLPRIESISAIADYLDCSVDYLLGRTDNPISHKNFNSDSLDILDLESLAQELTNHQSAAE